MEQQQNHQDPQPAQTNAGPLNSGGASENLEQLQQVCNAAQQLIKKALSAKNSQAFVAATVQGGGQ